jgi:hypothetical protein
VKRYPYFLIDGLFIVVDVLLLGLTIYTGILYGYLLVLLVTAYVAWRYFSEERRAKEFHDSISCIKGLESWESVFLSFGTLKFGYNEESVLYSSEIGQRSEGAMAVGYNFAFTNRSKTWFDIRRKADGKGFDVAGDKRVFALVKGDIEDFDRKYEITRIRQTDGLLQIGIRLKFSIEPLTREEKSAEMCEFLEDCLEFGLVLNKKLKTGGAKP